MSLRREFRNQLTRGAWQYAVVESISMGKATVRLATNGARLTNLSILGAEVTVDEKVIVDYSAEGPPTVRPYTILGTEPEEVIEDEEKEPDPPSFVYGKFTSMQPEIDGIWLVWDTVIADTWGMLNAPSTEIIVPLGNYVINVTVGVKTGMDYPNYALLAQTVFGASGRTLGYNNFRRSWWADGHLVTHQSGTYKTSKEAGLFHVRVDSAYHALAYVAGRYPLLEIYKIADIGLHKTHIPYWSWSEYDYPGQ